MDATPPPEQPRQPPPEPEPGPDATLAGDGAAAGSIDAHGSLPPVRLRVYRPPNRWLRALVSGFLLAVLATIVLWLLIR